MLLRHSLCFVSLQLCGVLRPLEMHDAVQVLVPPLARLLSPRGWSSLRWLRSLLKHSCMWHTFIIINHPGRPIWIVSSWRICVLSVNHSVTPSIVIIVTRPPRLGETSGCRDWRTNTLKTLMQEQLEIASNDDKVASNSSKRRGTLLTAHHWMIPMNPCC
jgi:hypothetical protein